MNKQTKQNKTKQNNRQHIVTLCPGGNSGNSANR
jgi:hypothetical protein